MSSVFGQQAGRASPIRDERHRPAPWQSLRDEGLLDSALARPLNLSLYQQPDVAALAAAYGVGLAKNQAFVDGNKRAVFLAVGLFLAINGYRLQATQLDATLTMLSVTSGDIDETTFAEWIRQQSQSR